MTSVKQLEEEALMPGQAAEDQAGTGPQAEADAEETTPAETVPPEPSQPRSAVNRPAVAADDKPVAAPTAKLNPVAALNPRVARLMEKKRQQEAMLREMFDRMDDDGGGTLDKDEVKSLAKHMGDNLKANDLHNAFTQMDKLQTGEVTFNQFKKWFFMRKDDERKAARKKAKEIFNEIDADGGGTLDIDEFKQLAKTLVKKFPKLELDPPFDLHRDFQEMDTDGHGEVSFPEFDYWWRTRTGDDDPDIPVLPESMVKKIDEISRINLKLGGFPEDSVGTRKGAELWDFLRPRLRLLVELEKRWGNIHRLYPTASASSVFEDKPLPDWIRNPDSPFSTKWDLAQVAALLYVSFIVPFRTSMDITTPVDTVAFWFDVVVDFYFIVDLVINFRTAFWDSRGTLEGDPRAIRKNYIGGGTELCGGWFPAGWFTIDFVSCLPVGYVGVIAEALNPETGDAANSNFRAFKTLRLLRLAKLLRLTRIKKILEKYEDQFDANQYLGLIFTLFIILFMAHMMACFWYLIGTGEQIDLQGGIIAGWVHNNEGKGWAAEDLRASCEAAPPATPTQISACKAVALKNTFGYDIAEDEVTCLAAAIGDGECEFTPMRINYGSRYVQSMYTCFNCEFAFTDAEHGFLMFSILVTGFIYGALAGVISTLLIGMAAGDQEFTAKLQSLKAWMGARNLSKQDRTKILAYYRAANKGSKAFNEQEILEELPPSLGGDVANALYRDILQGLPIFRNLGQEVMTHLCRMVKPMTALRGQIIIEQHKIGTEIYFITDGEVEVLQDDERLGFLGEGSFFGETPFLEAVEGKGGSGSEVRTRTIRASVDTDLGFIKREDMIELLEGYPELRIRIRQFARTGQKLSKKNKRMRMLQALKTEAMSRSQLGESATAEAERLLTEAEQERDMAQRKCDELAEKKRQAQGDGLPVNTAEVRNPQAAGKLACWPESYCWTLCVVQGLLEVVSESHARRGQQIRKLTEAIAGLQAEMDADRELFAASISSFSGAVAKDLAR